MGSNNFGPSTSWRRPVGRWDGPVRRRGGAVPVAAIAVSAAGGRGEGGVAAPLAVRRRVVVLQGKDGKTHSLKIQREKTAPD